ncbi:MAG: hypothetical protein Q7S87_12850 [Agitococcus sp.]|nr:hypothetical protein [Agitococcus sp.]
MTVIAAFIIDGCPVLFGDLLITGEMESSERIVAVPAVGEVQDFFGTSGWAVMGLYQKVTLLSDNCVIAWAGSWLGAKNAITDLHLLSQKVQLTCEIILRHLSNDEDLRQHQASFVGFVIEGNGFKQFQFGASQFHSPSLGTVYLAGSGSFAIQAFSDLLKTTNFKAKGKVDIVASAISRAIMLGSLLLQEEFRGGDNAATLMNMFGGGYEIASYQGRFKKLGDLTYVFWEAELNNDTVSFSIPQFIVKQKYIKDHLIIRSVRIENSVQASAYIIKDEQLHTIRPIHTSTINIEPSEIAGISLQSNLMSHCILVRKKDSIIRIHTFIQHYVNDDDMTTIFEDDDDHIKFRFSNDFILKMADSIKKQENLI